MTAIPTSPKLGYGMFAMEEKASSRVIGFCGIVHPGGQVEPEMKYALRRSHWGLAFEGVLPLVAYGVRVHRLSKIIATTAPENAASHRALLKAGIPAQRIAPQRRRESNTDLRLAACGDCHLVP